MIKTKLIAQHNGINVLTTMRHEIETRHEEYKVDEPEPVAAQGNFPLADEGLRDGGVLVDFGLGAQALLADVGVVLGQVVARYHDEDGGHGGEPEEGTPAVGGGVDEGAGEDDAEEVAEGVL